MVTTMYLLGLVLAIPSASAAHINQSAIVFGAGIVRYVDRQPVTTNRRLLRVFRKMADAPGLEFVRAPGAPVPFPKRSQSRANLSLEHGRITLHVAELWDVFQSFETGGYFGEDGFQFHHDVTMEFKRGTWADFEAGLPVHLITTLDGAKQAAADLKEIVGRSTIARLPAYAVDEVKTEAQLIAQLCENLFGGDGQSHFEITGATPKLVIEVEGTRTDLTVRYVNDVLVEATGHVVP